MIQPASVLHSAATSRPDARSVEIQRVFAVRPETLWDLFTDPLHYAKWWGPRNTTCTRCEIDLRVGGAWLTTLTFPDGDTATMHGAYEEIAPTTLLRFTWLWQGSQDSSPPSHVSLEFSPRGQGSLLRLVHSELPEDRRDGHERGWLAAFDSLDAHLETL